jgi:hypothetical protein
VNGTYILHGLTGLNNVLLPTLFTLVNNIVEPGSGVTILFNIMLTTVNNVGSKTLFNPVFINIATT